MKKIFTLGMAMAALCACETKKESTADCVAWIYDNARVTQDTDQSGQITNTTLELMDNEGYWLQVDNETALSLSPNWTMNNEMKFYTKDDVVAEHEKDACETKGRIKAFLDHVTELKKSKN